MFSKFLDIFKKKDNTNFMPSNNEPITAENFFNYDKSNPLALPVPQKRKLGRDDHRFPCLPYLELQASQEVAEWFL